MGDRWKWGVRRNGLAEFLSRPAWQQALVVFVDDDDLKRRQWLEIARGEGFHVAGADSAYVANQQAGDVYVFDISAVSGLYDRMQWSWSPICNLMDHHPGAIVIILSAVGRRYAEEVLDDIEERSGTRPHYGGTGSWEELYPIPRDVLGIDRDEPGVQA